ncbi:MAG: hypothetical protein HY238_28195 [Acidobacteria bacterium]|nr:hypothetical protein [Acidobacteriota bacterium]
MGIVMPPAFPGTEFRAFGIAASAFFPALNSDENLFDPLERRRHFDWSWQAVRYRYRLCAECNDEFKSLLANAGEDWLAGWGDEELTYKLERCIYYTFFLSGLSIFESFGFSLYFLGSALRPSDFPNVSKPKRITLEATSKALTTAFPQAAITHRLADLLQKPEFAEIDEFRNVLAHRVSGRRSVRAFGTTHPDGTTTRTREETWDVPGSTEKLIFHEEMVQRYLDEMTGMFTTLATAAREFAENERLVKAAP